jgi:hypothetical protein
MAEWKLKYSCVVENIRHQFLRAGIFFSHSHGKTMAKGAILIFMFLLLSPGEASANFSDKKFQDICSKMLLLLASDFGSILSAAAGIGAIIASAAGGFKVAWSLVVVAIGSFTLAEYQELWFKEC